MCVRKLVLEKKDPLIHLVVGCFQPIRKLLIHAWMKHKVEMEYLQANMLILRIGNLLHRW